MAYIVLVAGAVMALIGALAIVSGYPIIQVERGWATMIAGSSLLAGGVVTIALGLLLRAILDLRLVLSSGPIAHVATDQTIEPHVVPDVIVQNDGAPERVAVAASVIAVPAAALALNETHEPPATLDPAQAHPEPKPAIPYPAHEPPEIFQSPPIDDWLDRAFADIAHNPEPPIAGASPRTTLDHGHGERHLIDDGETIHAETRPAPHAVDPAPAHPVAATHEILEAATDHPKPAAEPPAPAPEPESAVIGRYEADGTFYTMYADGSIEAQSEAGVYRFASMAELKAFIEG